MAKAADFVAAPADGYSKSHVIRPAPDPIPWEASVGVVIIGTAMADKANRTKIRVGISVMAVGTAITEIPRIVRLFPTAWIFSDGPRVTRFTDGEATS
jgi:putative N-acetylmannosamine-6-phosphate epimerase